MSIFAKPFVITEKIRNRVFGPKPSVFTAVDINQESEVLVTAIERTTETSGARSINFIGYEASPNTLSIVGLNWTLFYDVEFSPSGVGIIQIASKGVLFTLPGVLTNFSGTKTSLASGNPPRLSFWLVAKKEVITFIANPTMSGVNGPGFPSPFASSDTVVWNSEAIIEHVGSGVPIPGGGLEVICKVGSFIYEDESYIQTVPRGLKATFIFETLAIDDLSSLVFSDRSEVNGGSVIPRSNIEVLSRFSKAIRLLNSKVLRLKRFYDVTSTSTAVATVLTKADVGRLRVLKNTLGTVLAVTLPTVEECNNGDIIDICAKEGHLITNNFNITVANLGTDFLDNCITLGTSILLQNGSSRVSLVLDKPNRVWYVKSSSNFSKLYPLTALHVDWVMPATVNFTIKEGIVFLSGYIRRGVITSSVLVLGNIPTIARPDRSITFQITQEEIVSNGPPFNTATARNYTFIDVQFKANGDFELAFLLPAFSANPDPSGANYNYINLDGISYRLRNS